MGTDCVIVYVYVFARVAVVAIRVMCDVDASLSSVQICFVTLVSELHAQKHAGAVIKCMFVVVLSVFQLAIHKLQSVTVPHCIRPTLGKGVIGDR